MAANYANIYISIDRKPSPHKLLTLETLSKEALEDELDKGYQDMLSGKTMSVDDVFDAIYRKYSFKSDLRCEKPTFFIGG